MKTTKKKVSDITVDELKSIIHDVIAEDIGIWRETFEVLADKRLMAQLKQADTDWLAGKKDAYVSWDELKRV
jgi:hypothetical protein